MADFTYTELLPLDTDETPYRRLTTDHVSTATFEGKTVLKVAPAGLEQLAEAAFKDVSHLLRPTHLAQLKKILDDPESSDNDRYVALEMLKNAVISADMVFPMCQDTGTAIVMGKKGQQVWTGGDDEAALSRGVFNAYTKSNLRYSQNAPLTMYEEKNTGCNLPAQIEIYATEGDAYKFLFIAKGGGSANKTYLFQETKAVLNPETLVEFLTAKMKTLGTAACPPYHLAVVVGGTSAEFNLKTVKLASARYLDGLPTAGSDTGHGFRDLELERSCWRVPGTWASAPSSAASISAMMCGWCGCPATAPPAPSASGSAAARTATSRPRSPRTAFFWSSWKPIRPDSCRNPGAAAQDAVAIDLNQPMDEIRSILSRYPVATRLLLTGRSSWPGTSPTPSSKSAWTAAKACPTISRTTSSITPARPRPPKDMPRAPSDPPPPAAWTLMCPCFRPRAPPWSCWPRATARQG